MCWEQRGCTGVTEPSDIPCQPSEKPHKMFDSRVWLLVEKQHFFALISVKLCCIPVASCRVEETQPICTLRILTNMRSQSTLLPEDLLSHGNVTI